MNPIKHYRELNVYQNAMNHLMQIFELTKSFPNDEKYSLTDQIRRSSRSVLSDAETEAAETQVHAEIAFRSGYLKEVQFQELDKAYDQILGQIVKMIDQPDKWLIRPRADL